MRITHFLGHRLSSQTNTTLFCTLCPHSCAPGRISRSVTHPDIAPGQARLTLEISHSHPLKIPTSSSVNPGQERPLLAPPEKKLQLLQGSALIPTLVFSAYFFLTRAHLGRISQSVTHPEIAPGQSTLNLRVRDQLPEKKLQLVDMSILLILLSPEPGYHT
uniref:Uncharacterized protein n=1 Tax=Oryza barthii TaxID=65489 RepID=A0A0D3GMC2_9ORYZ